MPVTGDFRELAALRRSISALADGEARERVNKNCALEATKLLDDTFQSGTDPYGNRWDPLTSRTGKPLLDTGAHLRGSLHATPTATGFVVATAFVGAGVHQYGAEITPKNAERLAFEVRGAPTKRSRRGKARKVFARAVTVPQRQYMPEGELGQRWEEGLTEAAEAALESVMKR